MAFQVKPAFSWLLLALLLTPFGTSCSKEPGASGATSRPAKENKEAIAQLPSVPEGMARATFAGGCFWCMEGPFDKVDGVLSTTSGYIDGHVKNPSYKQVSAGSTGHTEAVEIIFNPEKVTYPELLTLYWHNVDPTTANSQFCDHGSQYRPAIFTHGAEQLQQAQASRKTIEETKSFPEPIVVEIKEAPEFYAAEEYHQDFYKKNPQHYNRYRTGCGRDRRLEELWGKSGH